jgi:photosystem II stability/assembly factor-like uncharacterized protein
MKKIGLIWNLAAVVVLELTTLLAPFGVAQSQNSTGKPHDIFANLKFRNLGPAVAGGRVTSVVGIPGNPDVYYVGSAAGGVFKTTDGGITWQAVFTKQATASIGAIALAPSNPNLVWVGTGEANIRNDVIDGDGVYFSSDAGHTWKFMGLKDAGQISSIIVDPKDSNTVYVGVLGHAWAPNAGRGVFRTSDGGKTWKKVLYVTEDTGVSSLIMQPGNPEVLFAGMWEARRYPWMLIDGGNNSGIYRSTDGGDTWTKLTKGLPGEPLGRIALAAAPSNPNHLYALIGSKQGLLWQSVNMGDTWTKVSDNHALDVRPFYFSKMEVSPTDENRIFFLSLFLMESTDGGKTAHPADRGVHVDHHAIWIDPTNASRIAEGTDGGFFVSTDEAKHWRHFENLPIEQFYQVAVGSRIPYTVCGGLQDNSAWCGVSSDLGRGGVNGKSWYTVAGGDGEYAVPAASDSNVIYADAQDGFINHLDRTNHFSRFIRPAIPDVSDTKPADLKYRFNWTSPIAVSRTDANTVYLGANVLFKSTDGGRHWSVISLDLTRNDKSKQQVAGEPVMHDISGAETYDTILSITIAPTDPNVIWVGTDDGLVQVTRNGGKSWTNVTPNIPGAPQWAMVSQIGVSPFDAGAAYVAFDAHKLDNRHPYVYKTSNYGQSWEQITNGLPEDSAAIVVREDPNQRGLLVLGTMTGLYYSSDGGGHWTRLKSNFPTVPVFDLKFAKQTRDLVVATHGRGIFILDDIRPLEELSSTIEASSFHLFTPGRGTLFHHWTSSEGYAGYSAPNRPDGVLVDYFLKSQLKATPPETAQHHTPVKIVVTSQNGGKVATVYGPSKAGINRFVWAMTYDGAHPVKSAPPPPTLGFFNRNRGPRIVPGVYHIAVTVNGQTQDATATVVTDPNLHVPMADFRAQTEAALKARNELSALDDMVNRIDTIKSELHAFQNTVQQNADDKIKTKYASIVNQGKALSEKLDSLENRVYNTKLQRNAGEDDVHYLALLHGELREVAGELGFRYDAPPNALVRERMNQLFGETNQTLKDFNVLLKADVAAYNKAAHAAGAPTVFAASPITVRPPPAL